MVNVAQAEEAVIGYVHVDSRLMEQCADGAADRQHEQAGEGKEEDEVAADEVGVHRERAGERTGERADVRGI